MLSWDSPTRSSSSSARFMAASRLPSLWIRKRLSEDIGDPLAGIEGGIGILKDDLDIPAHPAQALLVGTGQILTLKRTVPSVGSMSRIMVRARVDFPQPDSPTMPRVSPLPNDQGDVVYGFDVLGGLGEDPFAYRKPFFQVVGLEQDRAFRHDHSPPSSSHWGVYFQHWTVCSPSRVRRGGCFWVQIFRQQAQRL